MLPTITDVNKEFCTVLSDYIELKTEIESSMFAFIHPYYFSHYARLVGLYREREYAHEMSLSLTHPTSLNADKRGKERREKTVECSRTDPMFLTHGTRNDVAVSAGRLDVLRYREPTSSAEPLNLCKDRMSRGSLGSDEKVSYNGMRECSRSGGKTSYNNGRYCRELVVRDGGGRGRHCYKERTVFPCDALPWNWCPGYLETGARREEIRLEERGNKLTEQKLHQGRSERNW